MRNSIIFLSICFFVCLYIGGFYKQEWLFGRSAEGEVLVVSPLWGSRQFGILFTHSVALTPVEEWFDVQGNEIILLSTIYQDFGAGLPHDVENGQDMIVKDGKIYIHGYNMRLQRLPVRVGRIAKHKLLLSPFWGKEMHVLSLEDVVSPGQVVDFTSEELSLFTVGLQYFKRVFI